MATVDHYRLLGVARHASPQAIRDAYVVMMKHHHPDRAGSGRPQAALAIALGEAYACLRNSETRAAYDAGLAVAGAARARRRRRPKSPGWTTRLAQTRFGLRPFLAVTLTATAVTAMVASRFSDGHRPSRKVAMPAPPSDGAAIGRRFIDRNAARAVDEARTIWRWSDCAAGAAGGSALLRADCRSPGRTSLAAPPGADPAR